MIAELQSKCTQIEQDLIKVMETLSKLLTESIELSSKGCDTPEETEEKTVKITALETEIA